MEVKNRAYWRWELERDGATRSRSRASALRKRYEGTAASHKARRRHGTYGELPTVLSE